jgi:hypothetical protein
VGHETQLSRANSRLKKLLRVPVYFNSTQPAAVSETLTLRVRKPPMADGSSGSGVRRGGIGGAWQAIITGSLCLIAAAPAFAQS